MKTKVNEANTPANPREAEEIVATIQRIVAMPRFAEMNPAQQKQYLIQVVKQILSAHARIAQHPEEDRGFGPGGRTW